MRKLLSVSAAVLLSLTVVACEDSTSPDQLVWGAQLRALDTEAGALNNFAPGDQVGTITVEDDRTQEELTVTGDAQGLSGATVYVSLFYDILSPPTGPRACEPVVTNENDKRFLTAGQMEIGPGDSPGPLAFWNVDSDDGMGTLGPTSTQEYVSVRKIGTVSIRDTRVADADIDGDGQDDPGAGPEAVVACGEVHAGLP